MMSASAGRTTRRVDLQHLMYLPFFYAYPAVALTGHHQPNGPSCAGPAAVSPAKGARRLATFSPGSRSRPGSHERSSVCREDPFRGSPVPGSFS